MWDESFLAGLTERCARNDAAAQRKWYAYCYPYGITVSLYYSSNREEAEEILQDSFLKVFTHFSRKRAVPDHQRTWFRRIIINTAIDNFRRRQRREKAEPHPPGVSHNEAIEALDTQDLYRLLQEIPPAYRLTFNLHVLEGYSHAEIARRLGVSQGTSKSNLSRARRHLRQLAGPHLNLDSNITNA